MPQIAAETIEKLVDNDFASDKSPKYIRIFNAVAEGIRSGRLKPGQRLPSESDLSVLLPVSLGTLQKALSRLVASGLVVRRKRSGTFVADASSRATEAFVYRFRNPLTNEIQMPFVRAIGVTEDSSPGPWRDELGGRRCVRLDRLLWIEQDPPAFASVYFSYNHGKRLLNVPIEQLHGASTHRFLVDRYNLPSIRIKHEIACRELSVSACHHLMVTAGTVGTVWDACDYSVDDKPCLFQRLQMAPGHRPLEISESLQRKLNPTPTET